MIKNLSWEEYALLIAETAMLKSKDPWKKTGCCLLRKDKSIAGIGFNGFPTGMIEDWDNRDERRKFVIHSEINALRYIKPEECDIAACSLLPCNDCLRSLAAYSIKIIVYREIYNFDPSTLELAEKFGINLKQIL